MTTMLETMLEMDKQLREVRNTLETVRAELVTLNPRLTEATRKNNEALIALVQQALYKIG